MSFYIGTPPAGEMPTSALGQAPGLDLTSSETQVASAATVDIGAVPTRRIALTGTTSISSFGTQPNRERLIRFTSALTLVNSGSLYLPTGSNITTVQGDYCMAVSDASGNWRVIAYQRADGTALVAAASGSVVYNAVQSLSSAQQVQAKRNIGAAGTNYVYMGSNTTIDGGYAGAYLLVNGGVTVTMPPISSVADHSIITFHAWSGACVIASNSADGAALFANGNIGTSSVNLRFGQFVQIYKAGNQWLFFGMATPQDDAPSVNVAQSFTRAQMARARLNMGAFPLYNTQFAANTTVDSSWLNRTTWLSGGNYTITVPAPSTFAVSGDMINMVNYAGGYITLQAGANSGFYYNGNFYVGTCQIGPGESAQLTTDGSSWIVGNRGVSPENAVQTYGLTNLSDGQKQNARYNILAAPAAAMTDRNLIVNGSMLVTTDSGGAAGNGSGFFPAEQWQMGTTVAGIQTQQVFSPFPSQPDILSGVKTTATSAAGVGAGDYTVLFQRIEGVNLACLGYGNGIARPFTLCFMVRANYTGTAYVSVANLNLSDGASNNTNRTYLARFSFNANVDTFVNIVVPGDVARTLGLGQSGSIDMRFTYAAGSNYQSSTENSWFTVSSGGFSGNAVSNLSASAGNSLTLGGVVMLPGVHGITQSQLGTFMRRYDEEEDECLRYFEIVTGTAITTGFIHYWFKKKKMRVGSASLRTGSLNGGSLNWYNPFNFRIDTGVGGASDFTAAFNARMT